MAGYRPTTPTGLVDMCAALFSDHAGIVVGGIDGAAAADPGQLAESVATTLRTRGRPAAVVHVGDYVRPASVRKEFGHTDTESYRTMWFDYAALDREVITAVHRSGSWLPRLWDEATDRSPRDRPLTAAADQVLIIAGPMLLGRGLALSPTVRLDMSPNAMRRSTPTELDWTVDAVVEHTRHIDEEPDLHVRYEHPDRPAVRDRT